jgi:hypothetical protein
VTIVLRAELHRLDEALKSEQPSFRLNLFLNGYKRVCSSLIVVQVSSSHFDRRLRKADPRHALRREVVHVARCRSIECSEESGLLDVRRQ